MKRTSAPFPSNQLKNLNIFVQVIRSKVVNFLQKKNGEQAKDQTRLVKRVENVKTLPIYCGRQKIPMSTCCPQLVSILA